MGDSNACNCSGSSHEIANANEVQSNAIAKIITALAQENNTLKYCDEIVCEESK